MAESGDYASRLLVSRMAAWTGMAWLASTSRLSGLVESEWVPGPVVALWNQDAPAYLYFALLVVANWGVVSVVQYVTVGYHPLVSYRLGFLPALAGLGGLWASRFLVDAYDDCREELESLAKTDSSDVVPETIAPWWLQVLWFGLLVAAMAAWLLSPGALQKLRAVQGPLGLPRHVAIFVLLRFPIVAESATVVLGVLLLLPWRLCRGVEELDLVFEDPSRLGGLESTAKLIRRATQVYFLGMFAVTLFGLAPRLFPNHPGIGVTPMVSVGILGAWLAGFVLFAAPNICFHRKMRDRKEERFEELRKQQTEHGSDEPEFPDYEELSDVSPDEIVPYLYLDRALQQAERTREYPTNPAILRDVVISSTPSIAMYLLTVLITTLGS